MSPRISNSWMVVALGSLLASCSFITAADAPCSDDSQCPSGYFCGAAGSCVAGPATDAGSGQADSGTPDAGSPDSGTPDAGAPDSGTPDAGPADSGSPDSGTPDAGSPDSGTPDAGAPDSGPTVPEAPTGVTATAGVASASVSWATPASNGGSTIEGYLVTSTPGSFMATTTGPGPHSAVVSGLTNGTSYQFTVVAHNAVGAGPASSFSNSVTPEVCFQNSDCVADATCTNPGTSTAACTCNAGYTANAGACSPGEIGQFCVDSTQNAQSTCAAGLYCLDLSTEASGNICTKNCTTTTMCGTGNLCANGVCFAGCAPTDGGNPCPSAQGCYSSTLEDGTIGNFCAAVCTPDNGACSTYGSACNSSGGCTQILCTSSTSCPENQVCGTAVSNAAGGNSMLCGPTCIGTNATTCPGGTTCDSTTGYCDEVMVGTYQACGEGIGVCASGSGCVGADGSATAVCMVACTTSTDCPAYMGTSMNCNLMLGTGETVCTLPCTVAADNCPAETACVTVATGQKGCAPTN